MVVWAISSNEIHLAVRLFHCREPNAIFVTAPIRAAANAKMTMLDYAYEYFKVHIKLLVTPGRFAPVSTDPRLRPEVKYPLTYFDGRRGNRS